jgi:hypothetical protein
MDLLSTLQQHAKLFVGILVLYYLLSEAHLEANYSSVVADDLVHLPAVAGEHLGVVLWLEDETLLEDFATTVMSEVLELVCVIETDLDEMGSHFAVCPSLEMHAAIGRKSCVVLV